MLMIKRTIQMTILLLLLVLALPINAQTYQDQPPRIAPANADRVGIVKYLSHGAIKRLLWSPTGKILAVSSTLGTWLYDTSNFKKTPRRLSNNDGIDAVAFSPDGLTLASIDSPNPYLVSGQKCFDASVHLWDVATGQERLSLSTQIYNVNSLVFSPDGNWLAVASSYSNVIQLWNLMTGHKEQELSQSYTSTVFGLALSSDGSTLVSVGDGGNIWLWDLKTAAKRTVFRSASDLILKIAYSPDGKQLVTSDFDGLIQFWDVVTGLVLHSMNYEPDTSALLYSPSGKWLIIGDKLLDAATGNQIVILPGTHNVFNSDEKYVFSATESDLIIHDLSSGQEYPILDGFSGSASTVTFPAGNDTIASIDNNHIRIWDAKSSTLLRNIVIPQTSASVFTVSPDLSITASLYRNSLQVWDTKSSKLRFELETKVDDWDDQAYGDYFAHLNNLVFGPDGQTLAFASKFDHQVRLFDMATGKILLSLTNSKGFIRGLAFSADGAKLAALGDSVYVYSIPNGKVLTTIPNTAKAFASLAYSADGSLVAAGGWQEIYIWDATTGSLRTINSTTLGMVNTLAFSTTATLLKQPNTAFEKSEQAQSATTGQI